MGKLIDGVIASDYKNISDPKAEYIDQDGFLCCSVCHKRTERIISIPSLGINKNVRCICECRQKELEAIKEREWEEELRRRRTACFAESNMANWTFENDDMKNAKITSIMKNYVKNFLEFKQSGRGLLLYGSVGSGKTYFAAAIANALIDEGYRAFMTNFAKIINQVQSTFEKRQEIIDSLNKYELLILDDLGAERNSEFMTEQVFNIIDNRYRSGLPMIITTNLTAEDLKKPQDTEHSRIYDRILERCLPIEVSGASRRRQKAKENFLTLKNKLGL